MKIPQAMLVEETLKLGDFSSHLHASPTLMEVPLSRKKKLYLVQNKLVTHSQINWRCDYLMKNSYHYHLS